MRIKARKLIWSVPLVAVFAVVGALALFATLTPNEAAAQDITATGMDLPGMVHNLTVEPNVEIEGGIPQEQLKVSWEPPTEGGAVVSYRIDLSFNGTEWYSYITDHGSSDLQVIYGDEDDPNANEAPLLAGSTRHFRVFAFNQQGTGPGVSMMGTTTPSDRPEPASGLEAAAANNADGVAQCTTDSDLTSITVAWNAPEDPPGAPVIAYRIEWSTEGTRWFSLEARFAVDDPETNAEGKLTYTHTGLLANTPRHYRVYAINSVGQSLVSENSAMATTGTSTVPPLPMAIEYILLSPDSTDIHIKWTEPEDPCGDPVIDYQIQARVSDVDGEGVDADTDSVDHDDDDDTPDVVASTLYRNVHSGTTAARDELNGLYAPRGRDFSTKAGITLPETGGVLVHIRMSTINRTGQAGTSPTDTEPEWLLMAQVPYGDSNLPRRQGNPMVEQDPTQNDRRTGLNISWPAATFNANKAPADEDHDADVRYVLAIDGEEEDDTASQRAGIASDGSADNETDRSHVGSDTSRQSTNDDALHAEDMRSYQVYPIRVPADLLGTLAITGTGVAADTDDVIRGFPNRTAVSGSTARPLFPGVPVDLAATAGGHTEIDLTWGAPVEEPDNACQADTDATAGNVRLGAGLPGAEKEDDGSECGLTVLIGYRVQISETGTSGWTTLATTGAVSATDTTLLTRHTVTMLTPGKRYYFRVAAVNSRGAGASTTHVSEDTDLADLPTPPGGLVAQAMSTTQLKICWYEHNLVDPLTGDAILDEGLPVLGYRITYVVGTGDDAEEMMLRSHTMSTETVYVDPSVLMPGSSRTYRVRSITLGNVDLVSGSDITLGGTKYSEASASTMQAAPTGLTAMASYDSATEMHSITVTWDAGGDAIDAYEVERAYKMDDGSMSAWMAVDPAHTGTNAMYMDSGLMQGTEYTYRVRSIMSTVPSAWSGEKSAVTHDVPDAPTVSAAATSDTEITVSWTAADNGSAITGYMVERGVMGADGTTMMWTAVNPAHAMDMGMMYMDTGLMEMTKYYYRVNAMNAVGMGDYSDGMAYAMTDRTNVAPMAGAAIDAQTVTAGMTVMVQSTITDADADDTLTWLAMSDMTMYATASADNMGMVTVTGVAAGDATITVTATDGMGESAMQTFMVTVEAANVAPMAGAAIDAQTVTAGMTVMVQSTITDADADDTLTWLAMSDMTMYATASADDMGMVTVTGVAAGDATITVTATDGMGESAMQTFMVTVEAADTTLGNAMGLAATLGTDPGDVTLTWTPGANATVHWIAGVRVVNGAIDPDFTPIWHAASGNGTHTVNAPSAGEYVFAVIAGQTSSGITEWSRWEIVRYTRP